MKLRKRVTTALLCILVVGFALIMALPLYYIVVNTFKSSSEMSVSPLGLPNSFDLTNYILVWNTTPILKSLTNTVVVTFFGVAFQVIIGSLAAYGMIIRKTRYTIMLGAILMIGFVVPTQATLIPLYRMEASLGIVDSLFGLVVLYLGGAIFCYFLVVGYMRKMPMEILEAARIDGASPFQIYWRIVLPIIKPIMITVVVFQTMGTWNDFLLPNVFLSSIRNRTLVLEVYNAVGQFSTDWPMFMTTTVIALIPVVVFFLFCQRWIVEGLAAGSIKG